MEKGKFDLERTVMTKIEFDAWFGNEMKHIEISAPFGMGGEIYHVDIDRYYNGVVMFTNGEWRIQLNPTTILQGDDVQILIDAGL